MILIKDTEPSEDMKPVRISASRGRGAETYLRDRCPEYGGVITKSLNLARRKPRTPSHQYKKIIWYG